MVDFANFDQDELLALAEFDMRRENYTEALEKLKIIRCRSDIPNEFYSMSGSLYASLGLMNKARAALTLFVENVPGAIHEHFQLGMIEKDSGNLIKAQKIWDDVLSKSENYPPALYYKAVSMVEVEEIQEAQILLDQLISTAEPTNDYVRRAHELIKKAGIN